jgi:hypothetical protein
MTRKASQIKQEQETKLAPTYNLATRIEDEELPFGHVSQLPFLTIVLCFQKLVIGQTFLSNIGFRI